MRALPWQRWIGALRAGVAHRAVKPVVFAAASLPFAWLVWAALTQRLGPNPAEALIRSSGDWTLRFLCIVLAVTPLRVITATPALGRLRRMLGLFVYFYAVLHMLCYGWLDMEFVLADIARDIGKRPFILVGFLALSLLTLLAATSSRRAIRRLGGRLWQRLHRLVYVVAGLAVLHFFWMRAGKNDFAQVILYCAILGVLLAWRLVQALRKWAGATGRLRPG